MQVTNPIRIAYIIDSLKLAGTQTELIHIVRGLNNLGYEQRVYCLNNATHPKVLNKVIKGGAKVTVIGKLQIASIIGIIRLWRDLTRWSPHIVQTFLPVSDIIGRIIAKVVHVPLIMTSIQARNIDKKFWQFWLDRWTMHWADRVIFNSKSVIPYSIKHEGVHPDQAVYIPNGVALDWGESDSKTSNFRGQFGLTEDTCIIGTIGRLNPQKGHSFLFKAFAKLQERYQNLALIIVGDGPLRQELEELAGKLNISNQVFFLGERSDIPVILSEINVYAHPSIFEGMPNAVMEAMVAGKPVVATEVDGIGELIQHRQTGVLVKVQSAEALEDGLSELIGNQGFRNQIAKAAALRMKKEFSVEKMVNSFDQLYQDRLRLKLSA